VQGIWRAGLNWSAGRTRTAGRSLVILAVDRVFDDVRLP